MVWAGGGRQGDARRLLAAVILSVAIHAVLGAWPGRTRPPAAKERYFIEIGIVEAADFVPDRAPVRNLAEPASTPVGRIKAEAPHHPNADEKVGIADSATPPEPAPSASAAEEAALAERPAVKAARVVSKEKRPKERGRAAQREAVEKAEPARPARSSSPELSVAGAKAPPRPVSSGNPSPRYPRLAVRRGWEGEVVLRVRVTSSGRVDGIRVHISSGHDLLDDSAVEAVRSWRFHPARRGTDPVASVVRIPVRFRLEQG